MGVQTYSQEISSAVAPARLFKALCLDSHNLLPKLMPESFSSIEFVQGNSVATGAVKQVNFTEGMPFAFVKHKYEVVDVENMYFKYTVMEGDALGETVKYGINEVRFAGAGSECICTFTSHYYPQEGAVLDEERIKFGQEKMRVLYKKVEAYLVANPDAYV